MQHLAAVSITKLTLSACRQVSAPRVRIQTCESSWRTAIDLRHAIVLPASALRLEGVSLQIALASAAASKGMCVQMRRQALSPMNFAQVPARCRQEAHGSRSPALDRVSMTVAAEPARMLVLQSRTHGRLAAANVTAATTGLCQASAVQGLTCVKCVAASAELGQAKMAFAAGLRVRRSGRHGRLCLCLRGRRRGPANSLQTC